jgi:hypothetical protein
MIWVDLALALLALALLVVTCLTLYRRVRGLGRTLGAGSTRIADASVDLNAQQSKATARR